jgi:FtsH-binding integral membrane protein
MEEVKKIEKEEINEIMEDLSNNEKRDDYNKQDITLNINDPDSEEATERRIHDQMRLGFIRKVYGILSMQLLITVVLCSLTFYPEVKMFMIENMGVFWIAASLSIILVIPLVCFQSVARRVPYNYILLMFWTLAEAYIVACCCSLYSPKVVIMAAVSTFTVTAAITLYAWTTKTDFTYLGGFLFSCVSCILLLTIFSFFMPFLHILICVFGVFVYSLYLLYDTQLIFGKVGVEYSVDDYIIAALNIYLDIIQIFIYLLEIFGRLSDN